MFINVVDLLSSFELFLTRPPSLYSVDLHRKNSPTGLKRLNSAIHQDQRSGRSNIRTIFYSISFPCVSQFLFRLIVLFSTFFKKEKNGKNDACRIIRKPQTDDN